MPLLERRCGVGAHRFAGIGVDGNAILADREIKMRKVCLTGQTDLANGFSRLDALTGLHPTTAIF